MVNPVAGSFSERVPILVISGGPGRGGAQARHAHPPPGEGDRVAAPASTDEVTCAARVLDDPATAAPTRSTRSCARSGASSGRATSRSTATWSSACIEVPRAILEWDGRLPEFARSDERKVREAARETAARFNAARAAGGDRRHREPSATSCTRERACSSSSACGAPCVTTVLAKGAFPMDHPLHMGVLHRRRSARRRSASASTRADLVLNLGTLLTDMNLGEPARRRSRRERSIWAVDDRVNVSFHTYTDVAHPRLRRARCCAQRAAPPPRAGHLRRQPEAAARGARRAPSRVADVLREVNRFLAGRRGYIVVAESGDMLFAGLDVRVEARRRLPRAGLLRVDGLRRAGRARRADRHRPAADRALRRRRLPDDRAGDRAGAALRRSTRSSC